MSSLACDVFFLRGPFWESDRNAPISASQNETADELQLPLE
jgi:hypothetical protein